MNICRLRYMRTFILIVVTVAIIFPLTSCGTSIQSITAPTTDVDVTITVAETARRFPTEFTGNDMMGCLPPKGYPCNSSSVAKDAPNYGTRNWPVEKGDYIESSFLGSALYAFESVMKYSEQKPLTEDELLAPTADLLCQQTAHPLFIEYVDNHVVIFGMVQAATY